MKTLGAGVFSTTASVMSLATTMTVCLTTLTAETKKKFASEFTFNINMIHLSFFCADLRKPELIPIVFMSPVQYMRPTVSTTMLMDAVTKAATQKSVAGTAWTVQRRFQRILLMVSWFWLSYCRQRSFYALAQLFCRN